MEVVKASRLRPWILNKHTAPIDPIKFSFHFAPIVSDPSFRRGAKHSPLPPSAGRDCAHRQVGL